MTGGHVQAFQDAPLFELPRSNLANGIACLPTFKITLIDFTLYSPEGMLVSEAAVHAQLYHSVRVAERNIENKGLTINNNRFVPTHQTHLAHTQQPS